MCFAPKIPAPPRPPQPEDASLAGLRERQRLAGAHGWSSTILTSGLGTPAAPVSQPKTLLGG